MLKLLWCCNDGSVGNFGMSFRARTTQAAVNQDLERLNKSVPPLFLDRILYRSRDCISVQCISLHPCLYIPPVLSRPCSEGPSVIVYFSDFCDLNVTTTFILFSKLLVLISQVNVDSGIALAPIPSTFPHHLRTNFASLTTSLVDVFSLGRRVHNSHVHIVPQV